MLPITCEDNPMARMIRHEEMGPYEVPEGTELPIYVCGCGLSKNKPFCDGSHKKTRAEAAGEVYEYDANGNARLVAKH
jgi:CDGSH iron-sulfur domain-containing protein 3